MRRGTPPPPRLICGQPPIGVPFHLYERKEEGWGDSARFARSNMMTLYTMGNRLRARLATLAIAFASVPLAHSEHSM